MKSTRLILSMVVCVIIYSCQKAEKTTQQPSSRTVDTNQKADEIIRDTVVNNDGVRLYMAFDNANHTARFVLKGEVIDLKQNSLASGVKYSNSVYEFYEHQGKGMLKKAGNVIFSYKKPASE